MVAYLSQDYFSRNICFTLIFKPYGQGLSNLQKAMPWHEPQTMSREYDQYRVCKCMHLIVGFALLIPVINFVALLILHLKFQSQSKKIIASLLDKELPDNLPSASQPNPTQDQQPVKQSLKSRLATYAKKTFNAIRHPSTIKLVDRFSGIRVQSAYDAFNSVFLAGAALRARKLKIFGAFALMSIGNGINSIFNLFVPRDVRAINRIHPDK